MLNLDFYFFLYKKIVIFSLPHALYIQRDMEDMINEYRRL